MRRRGPVLPWIAATAVVTAAIAGLVGWSLQPTPESQPVNRFDYSLPDGRSFRSTGRPVIAVSPDGRHFAYNTNQGLFLRSMSDLEARIIPGTELDGRSPEFSPDSQSVAYYDIALNQIRRSAISGGAPVVIASVPENLYGLSWEGDGTILYGQPEGVYRVPATGGTPELIIPTEEDTIIYGARLLPDGDSVMFSVGPIEDWDLARIVAQSLSTGERRVLVEGGYDARYVPTGHLIYALDDGLFAVVFDAATLTVSGGAVPLVDEVMRGGIFTGTAHYGVADDGTLVYVRGTSVYGF